MNLEGSIDAWIQETKDMLLQVTTLIEKADQAKRYHNTMVIPESLSKAGNDIDLAGLQIDKAINQLNAIKGRLEKRIQNLENEKRQAHETEGAGRRFDVYGPMGYVATTNASSEAEAVSKAKKRHPNLANSNLYAREDYHEPFDAKLNWI